jgi:osmotically-inducible protein OsmY
MRDFFIGLVVGVFLTAATGWYFVVARNYPGVRHTWDVIDARLAAWHLRADDVAEELARTGQVLRRQARGVGAAVADASSDAAITGKIKAKFAIDSNLSALGISVNTTDGHVTLAGAVASHQLIGKAVLIALETDGVREVSSTLQIKKPNG